MSQLDLSGEPATSTTKALLARACNASAYELWQMNKKKLKMQKHYLDGWKGSAKLFQNNKPADFILSATMPLPAFPHGTTSAT